MNNETISVESNVVFLRCQDIETTTKFYCDYLGLSVWNDQGSCRIFKSGSGLIGFLQHETAPVTEGICLSFNVHDIAAVDQAYKILNEKGIANEQPSKHPKFEVYSFFFNDPDGYIVELQKIL